MSTTTTSDRRRAPRRLPALGTVLRLEGEPSESPSLGLVWNLSTTGVSLLVSQQRPAGTPLRGKLVAERALSPLPVELTVAHVSKIQTGDYFLGCQFAQALTEEQLRPFLAEQPREPTQTAPSPAGEMRNSQ